MSRSILYSLLLILVIASGQEAAARSDSLKIPFVAYWSKGDTYSYAVTKIKRQWKDSTQIKNDSTRYTARFEVIDSTADAYKIRWTFDRFFTNNFRIPEEVTEKVSQYDLREIIYTTDELGSFKGIENWKEVSEIVQKFFDVYLTTVSKEMEIPEDTLRKATLPLIEPFKTRSGIENAIFPELSIFHFPFGAELSARDTLEYETVLPNIFGGDPFKATGYLYFEEVDEEEQYCEFVQELYPDDEEVRRMFEDVFRKMNMSKEILKKMMEESVFQMENYNRFHYYYNPGIPVWISSWNEINIKIEEGPVRVLNLTSIELLDEE